MLVCVVIDKMGGLVLSRLVLSGAAYVMLVSGGVTLIEQCHTL